MNGNSVPYFSYGEALFKSSPYNLASFKFQAVLKFHPCVKIKHLLQNFICCKGHCYHGNCPQVVDAHTSVETPENTILLVNEGNCTNHPHPETENQNTVSIQVKYLWL